MTEDQARKLEVPIKWNGKANVCVYCGRVPETCYVVTGHDHTDDSIRWCICREAGQYKDEITTLRQRVAKLEKERDRLSELCDKWNFECDDMREDNNRLANVANALKQQRDELLAAAEAIEIYAEECLDFDECTALISRLMPDFDLSPMRKVSKKLDAGILLELVDAANIEMIAIEMERLGLKEAA